MRVAAVRQASLIWVKAVMEIVTFLFPPRPEIVEQDEGRHTMFPWPIEMQHAETGYRTNERK